MTERLWKLIVFSMEGVLRDKNNKPIQDNIDLMNSLYSNGHDVVILTEVDDYFGNWQWLDDNRAHYDKVVKVRSFDIARRTVGFALLSHHDVYQLMRANGVVNCYMFEPLSKAA